MNGNPQPNDEYRVLRDEMLNLFTRVLLVFTATVTAFVALTLKGLEQTNPLEGGLILLLAILIVVVGILLNIEFYQNLYSIGSYIIVYFEDPAAGWHIRSRHMRIVLKESLRETKLTWLEKINEPGTVGLAYLLIAISLPVLFVVRFGFPQSKRVWIVALLTLAFCIAAVSLLRFLRNVYREGSRKWVKRWDSYKKSHPNPKISDIQ